MKTKNDLRIEFLEKELAYHKERVFHYEMQDGFGEFEKADKNRYMVSFLGQWIEEMKEK